MAIKFTISKHHVCFPNKVLSGLVGHTYNIRLTEDTDNGTVVSRGDWVAFDEYSQATAPAKYEGVIREQAADGNWYVEVVEPADAILIYEVPENKMGNYDSRFTAIDNFYNEKGKTVRGYSLAKGDIYELSTDAFTGTPAAGKKVTITGQKHVVAAGA